MTIQVLVATMHQKNKSFIKKMNLQSDSIIVNQTDNNSYEEIEENGYKHQIYSFAEKGVGLSRNTSLMRADADYALIADDDLVYVDGYPELVKKEFEKYPEADILIFNLKEEAGSRYIIRDDFKVSKLNYMRFGAARVVVRPESIKKKGISFHLCFGGGTEYSNGEDTIFLRDCLEQGLNIIAVPITIAELTDDRESTWFEGYTEKYYKDRGALFKVLSPKLYLFLIIQFVIRKYNKQLKQPTRMEQIKLMYEGSKSM